MDVRSPCNRLENDKMKKVVKIAVTLIALSAFAPADILTDANATNANFAERKVREINAEGRAACRALGGSGYKASVVGIIEAGSRSGYANFRVKTCFSTLAQCQQFIANINREISKIDLIRSRTCRPQ